MQKEYTPDNRIEGAVQSYLESLCPPDYALDAINTFALLNRLQTVISPSPLKERTAPITIASLGDYLGPVTTQHLIAARHQANSRLACLKVPVFLPSGKEVTSWAEDRPGTYINDLATILADEALARKSDPGQTGRLIEAKASTSGPSVTDYQKVDADSLLIVICGPQFSRSTSRNLDAARRLGYCLDSTVVANAADTTRFQVLIAVALAEAGYSHQSISFILQEMDQRQGLQELIGVISFRDAARRGSFNQDLVPFKQMILDILVQTNSVDTSSPIYEQAAKAAKQLRDNLHYQERFTALLATCEEGPSLTLPINRLLDEVLDEMGGGFIFLRRGAAISLHFFADEDSLVKQVSNWTLDTNDEVIFAIQRCEDNPALAYLRASNPNSLEFPMSPADVVAAGTTTFAVTTINLSSLQEAIQLCQEREAQTLCLAEAISKIQALLTGSENTTIRYEDHLTQDRTNGHQPSLIVLTPDLKELMNQASLKKLRLNRSLGLSFLIAPKLSIQARDGTNDHFAYPLSVNVITYQAERTEDEVLGFLRQVANLLLTEVPHLEHELLMKTLGKVEQIIGPDLRINRTLLELALNRVTPKTTVFSKDTL
jgi:hypothetical protein